LRYQNWSTFIMKILINDPMHMIESASVQSFESGLLELIVKSTGRWFGWHRVGSASWLVEQHGMNPQDFGHDALEIYPPVMGVLHRSSDWTTLVVVAENPQDERLLDGIHYQVQGQDQISLMYLPDELFKGATELAAYKSASVQQSAQASNLPPSDQPRAAPA
jgi:hypothetical protein